ncbi:DUF1302 domain-containing protein [Cupriavidus basilensis]|uniref:DUF1302 domain-containing protein n=1 Tax=Cupriavidus basilensis TaxID=68895 RepID=UPI0023E8C4D2|nr:DUF1302 domain-containing protein [Cupriavidus basilensis]MDF3881517.1 DUF1302 domain-containing protein [Cupriavidus basilensis]
MRTIKNCRQATISLVVLGTVAPSAHAFDFTAGPDDAIKGSLVTNITAGAASRTKNPSCSLTGDPNTNGCGTAANVDQWGAGDNGDLNYKKGKPYSTYLSATSELLLTMPGEGLKFMARGTGMYDFMAKNTERTELASDARAQVVYDAYLLDLWAQKDFTIGDRNAHVRLGNQVINWGESMFATGGINATNSLDMQKLLVPGSQLKQAVLPAPMLSFASELSHGVSTEAYYQFIWKGNRIPPVGSYWSVSNVVGRGAEPFTVNPNNFNANGPSAGTIAGMTGQNAHDPATIAAINNGLVNGEFANSFGLPVSSILPSKYKPQFGVKFNYAPRSIDANFAFYYENYTDKSPVLTSFANNTLQWSNLENRQLFGVSANFPLGPWAVGTELSYRPRDAVALSSCYGAGGPPDLNVNPGGVDCQQWADKKKFQFGINGLLALTRSEYPFLKWIGADSGTLTAELTWIYYPGLSQSGVTRTVNGQQVTQLPQAGYLTWLNNNSGTGYPIGMGQGTSSSVGTTIDFNWTYDGTLIPGWQVTPGVTFSAGLYGYTPTFSANYLQGLKSANLYILFNQNPTKWQAGVNYTMFWGGHNTVGNPYSDRNFVGLFVTRNF